jgi:hypothetical protein
MAVLVEAISVIVRVDAIMRRFVGGWPDFRDAVPNATFASDNEIARAGFMAPDDVAAFIAKLEVGGLIFLRDGKSVDMAVVDQQRGPTKHCDWLDWGHVAVDGNRISACRITGSLSKTLMKPEGWTFEGSLSQTFGFVPGGQEDWSLELLGRKDGIDMFHNLLSGKDVYVGRTTKKT